MPSIQSLLSKLQADHPTFLFVQGNAFAWNPDTCQIHYTRTDKDAAMLLLHEVGHGLLGHASYTTDVQLLEMEAAAWQQARQLATRYSITIPSRVVEDNLDTYRDWLHARSRCPQCTSTGYQTARNRYTCPACLAAWRVNEARHCQLRRYQIAPSS